jgi:preprotein translocase subunit SecD
VANRGGHPGRTLIIFGIIVAALYGLMAISNNWTPKLGLDLQGGTTITLTARARSIRTACSWPGRSSSRASTAWVSARPR